MLALAAERSRQFEQQQSMQQRILQARQAASRRTTIAVWVLIAIFLVVPALSVGALFFFGIRFGTRALDAIRDQSKNGLLPLASEIQQKMSQGCHKVVHPPEVRVGGAGTLRLPLTANGPCVHVMGSTTASGAELTLEQLSQHALQRALPKPASAFDYRLCPATDAVYEFSVTSDRQAPYSIAAVACPRTVAEGLVRSAPNDPVSTGLEIVRGWSGELEAKGCTASAGGLAVVQGDQTLEIESSKGGACFQLSVASHFADVKIAVRLWSPTGELIAQPTAASRVQLEYCPNATGKHRIEIGPSTRDHFAMASFDCPRRKAR